MAQAVLGARSVSQNARVRGQASHNSADAHRLESANCGIVGLTFALVIGEALQPRW